MIKIEMPKACSGCAMAEGLLRGLRLPPSTKWKKCEDGFLRFGYTCMPEEIGTCKKILAFKEMEAWNDSH